MQSNCGGLQASAPCNPTSQDCALSKLPLVIAKDKEQSLPWVIEACYVEVLYTWLSYFQGILHLQCWNGVERMLKQCPLRIRAVSKKQAGYITFMSGLWHLTKCDLRVQGASLMILCEWILKHLLHLLIIFIFSSPHSSHHPSGGTSGGTDLLVKQATSHDHTRRLAFGQWYAFLTTASNRTNKQKCSPSLMLRELHAINVQQLLTGQCFVWAHDLECQQCKIAPEYINEGIRFWETQARDLPFMKTILIGFTLWWMRQLLIVQVVAYKSHERGSRETKSLCQQFWFRIHGIALRLGTKVLLKARDYKRQKKSFSSRCLAVVEPQHVLGCNVMDHAQVQVCLLVLLVSFGLDWLFAMPAYLIT